MGGPSGAQVCHSMGDPTDRAGGCVTCGTVTDGFAFNSVFLVRERERDVCALVEDADGRVKCVVCCLASSFFFCFKAADKLAEAYGAKSISESVSQSGKCWK